MIIMVTPELKNYITGQLKLGIRREDLKTTLLQNGWPEADINDAFKEYDSSAASSQTSPVIMPTMTDKSFPASGAAEKPAPFVTRDIVQEKNEPVFRPKTASPVSKMNFDKNASPLKTGDYKKFILPGILILIIVVLVVATGFFYSQTSGLNSQISDGQQKISSLTQEISSLGADKNNLNSQISSLNQTVQDLTTELSLFALPSGVSSTEAGITLKGVLSGGGKSLYTLITSRGSVVYIKNSKDAAVVSALKDLVNKEIEIGGNHLIGSNYITASMLNGQPIVNPTSTSTAPTAATSTSK